MDIRELCAYESRRLGKKCHAERQALSDCSEEKYGPLFVFLEIIDCSVTVLKTIKQACSSSIEKYDACLAKNKSNPLNCIDVLREVYLRYQCKWTDG